MRLTTKIALSFLLSIAIICVIGFTYRRNLANITAAYEWVEHTHTVIQKLQSLELDIADRTAGVRGFVISGDRKALSGTVQSPETFQEHIAEIRKLTADNASQQPRLNKLETLVDAMVQSQNQVLSTSDSQGFEQSKQLIRQNGLTNLAPIHQIILEMSDDENRLLSARTAKVFAETSEAATFALWLVLLGICLKAGLGLVMTLDIRSSLKTLLNGMATIGNERGDEANIIKLKTHDEFASIAKGFNLMSARLHELSKRDRQRDWLNTSLNDFAHDLQGQRSLIEASQLVVAKLSDTVGSKFGAIYGLQPAADGPQLRLLSSYGCDSEMQQTVNIGEGLVGQSARELKIVHLNDAVNNPIKIRSALTETVAAALVVVPVAFEGHLKAVIELASLRAFTEIEVEFLQRLAIWLGLFFNTIESSQLTEKLLTDAQVMNEELVSQQEELRQLNEELEQKAEELDIQNQSVASANYELEVAQRSVEQTVDQLALASKYKSEFLANVSHDLRTPLNSLLILANLLADNDGGNLLPEQVEFARNIMSSGKTLLGLVDNILDLSKIESGIIKWDLNEVSIADLVSYVDMTFRHMADQKNIAFSTSVQPGVPDKLVTDERRLQQLLTNLLSNAFKFTEVGAVEFSIDCVDVPIIGSTGAKTRSMLAISVTDSGIGIPADKQDVVFEAFQQVDGSSKRKYGGTGLGLAICKQIALGLGGDITLESEEGKGSTFKILLPIGSHSVRKRVLVVEDNNVQRDGLVKTLQSADMEVFGAVDVDDALTNLRQHRFDCLVLDLGLNGKSGYDLINELDRNAQLRELPIIIYTGRDISREEETILRKSAKAIILKGANSVERLESEISLVLRRIDDNKIAIGGRPAFPEEIAPSNAGLVGRNVLIVDDDARNIFALTRLLERYKVRVSHAESGREAIAKLESDPNIELVLMDVMMPELDGCETISILRTKDAFKQLPILAVTAKAMKGDRQKCIDAGASDYITKPIDVEHLLSLLRVWLCRK